MGRSKGGLTTKIHALVDANGLPIWGVIPVGLRPPCMTPHIGNSRKQPADDPLIRCRSLCKQTEPPLTMNGIMEDCGFWQHEWSVTSVYCNRSPNPGEPHQRRAAERLRAKWRELDTGHLPFLSAPDELTTMLLE